MKPSEVAPGMVFSAWTVLGPACPEMRGHIRYVEAECWGCKLVHDVAAQSLVSGGSKRCKPCSLGKRRAAASGHQSDNTPIGQAKAAKARRLAMIKKAAEAWT